MGIETTITKTAKKIDLRRLFDIVHVVENGFDWWLGDGSVKPKVEKWRELHDFAFTLSRNAILDAEMRLDCTKTLLASMTSSSFNMHLALVLCAIKDYQEGDSHLFIDIEALPEMDILTSCSWTLRSILLGCNNGTSEVGEDIDELNPDKVRRLADRWRRKASDFRLGIARWIGYFIPAARTRMVEDIVHSLGLEGEGELDLEDIVYLKESIMRISNSLKDDNEGSERLWVISSY